MLYIKSNATQILIELKKGPASTNVMYICNYF